MSVVLKTLVGEYAYLYHDLRDKRTDGFWLVSTPWPVLVILGLYCYFIFNFGPKFMKNRPAYNLKKVLVAFNVGQILLNGYIFFQGARHLHKFSLKCSPVDYSNDEFAVFTLNLVWLYFVTKLIDLFDTVFFVLRKKSNQVSFLHVYHHVMMCVLGLVGTRYIGGGHSVFVGVINSFVHVCMYGYYLLAAYDSSYQRNIWWKKYITILQITQFFLLFLIYVPLAFDYNCTFPKPVVFVLAPQNLLMVILFSKFYYTAYIKPKNKNT